MLLWLAMQPTAIFAAKKNQPTKPVYTEEQLTEFDYYYYAAIEALNGRYPDRAMLLLRHCLTICPDNAGANVMLGVIYETMNWAEALDCYAVAVAQEPENWIYRRHYVEALSKADEQQKAIDNVLEELELNPRNDDAWNVLSILYKIDKQYAKSIRALNALEKIVGIDEYISFEKFKLYVVLRKLQKGVAEVDKLIAEYPENYRYKVLRGDIFMEQQMPEQAFEIYQKVLKEDSENPYIYLSLSEYYKTMGEPEKATKAIIEALENKLLDVDTKLSILEQYAEKLVSEKENMAQMDSLLSTMVEMYPLEEQVHGYYALYLLKNNRLAEAEKTMHTMLDINPKNEKTWLQLIDLALKESADDKVFDLSQKAIAQLPENPIFYFYKGLVEFTRQDYETALQSNLLSLSLLSKDQTALQLRLLAQIGDIYFKMGNQTLAYAAYEDALKCNANDLSVLNNYAYYLSVDNQNLKKAERMSAKTVESEPTNPVYLDTYAWIFYKQGNYSLAKFYIERAIDNMPNDAVLKDPEIWEHYGYILHKTGNEEKAREAWQKALLYGSDNAEIKTLLQ